jgi:hypothetical protein
MEHERLKFKIVIADGADSEILARVAHLDIAGSATWPRSPNTRSATSSCATAPAMIERHDGKSPPDTSVSVRRATAPNAPISM